MREVTDVDLETVDRAALLDLEGTLIPDEGSWPEINQRFGMSADEERDLFEQYHKGDPRVWRDEIERRWKQYGIANRESFLEALPDPEVPEEAHMAVEALRDRGFCTMLVSGALDTYTRRMAQKIGVDVHVPTWSLVFDEEGQFQRIDAGRYCAKVDLARDLAAAGATVWAIGNGENDVDMVRAADRAFMVPNRDTIDYGAIGVEPVERRELPDRLREGGTGG